ncbi:MAG: SDR family oxidoreductase [Eubacteriales bacterium]|nr:SDR family oxidoreductase [Eubacteriales bacterium]
MKALITGASSGIGRDMAHVLAGMGYDLILVARRKELLAQLKEELPVEVRAIALDLGQGKNCMALYAQVKDEPIEILINNAGFGLIGPFHMTDINTELAMIDINIKAVHILTKLFLKDFIKRDSGYILNVSSLAGFLPGPLMAAYYASKAYVRYISEAVWEELRQQKSNVSISALCPGPVPTAFNKIAQARRISGKGLPSAVVARYAIKQMFKKKRVIVPGFGMKAVHGVQRILPMRALLAFAHKRMTHKGALDE